MNPRTTAVIPDADHALVITFSDGQVRRLDVRPYLAFPVFDRLRDATYFAQVRADHGTVAWPDGIDLDPDSVYLDSVPIRQHAAA
jgi:hypothetical protein